MSERAYPEKPMQGLPTHEDSRNVRNAAYWLRKAVRARASAKMYPEDRAALENIAEMYEQMAERIAELAGPARHLVGG
jgi:hypothetical protein